MEGLLLSATVLLLLIFLLRVLPGRWVSRRLVYGLWLLAAARLLIPVGPGQPAGPGPLRRGPGYRRGPRRGHRAGSHPALRLRAGFLR